jgi:hypothetical protein
MSNKIPYSGFVPPCGIFCGTCPNFTREKNKCQGADIHCKTRKCKGIYVCCIEKRGLEYCFQCSIYPCSKLQKFANNWLKYGQNLLQNQNVIKNSGKDGFLKLMNEI